MERKERKENKEKGIKGEERQRMDGWNRKEKEGRREVETYDLSYVNN